MAKESMKAREVKRAKLVARYAESLSISFKRVTISSPTQETRYSAFRWLSEESRFCAAPPSILASS